MASQQVNKNESVDYKNVMYIKMSASMFFAPLRRYAYTYVIRGNLIVETLDYSCLSCTFKKFVLAIYKKSNLNLI